LLQNVKREIHAKDLSYETISKAIASFPPNAQITIFIPIDFYSALHLIAHKRMHVEYRDYRPTLLVGSKEMRVIWSNKYVPFEEIILIGRGFGEWIVKLDENTGQTLTFDLRPASGKKIDVTVRTIAMYSILAEKEGILLRIPSRQDPSSRKTERT